ncbi:MAG: glycosyl hydrolase family 32 [Lentisphaerae bacterium]|nr:glycosyl hydrolase family 32 [Lentisphaerota bacterium]
MKKLLRSIGMAGLIVHGVAVASASESRSKPLPGKGTSIEYRGEGEPDTFKPGATLFTNRTYTVAECPAWLQGKRFLRGNIDFGHFRATSAGVLTLLTPEPVHPRASTQARTLEARGVVWVAQPERFQLFGKQPFDLVRVYQKQVQPGERFRLGKWTVAVGFESATRWAPANRPWTRNQGERLYNGIVLPREWPPQDIDPRDTAPMPVPYLKWRPAVVPIDVGRQLFVDDFLVETTNLKRVFHMPVKYRGNPVLKPETALEINAPRNAAAAPKSGGVWWDPKEQVFKMWYEAGWIHTICYATSRDGLTWERPAMDVTPGTNQALPPDLTPDSWTVVPDWNAKDPQQRYKMFLRPPGGNRPGWSMTSADGIHWVNRTTTGVAGDRSTMFYNPFRRKWVYSLRSAFRGRSRHYWETDDFLAGAKWPADGPVVWAAADREDPPDPKIGRTAQLYNLDAVAYESILLGVFEIHRGPPNGDCMKAGLPKITELSFAYSRDGFHWHRPDRRAHIPADRRDVWDRAYVQSIGNVCTVRGDRLWIYYTGFQGDSSRLSSDWLQNGMYDNGSTGVAFLRRDGFASMDAGAGPAALTTRPVTFTGSRVFVNAAVAKGGELRVEILNEAGEPIQPYTRENCRAVQTDGTLEPVVWSGAEDVSALCGKPVRFRFTLREGALYAFWVSRNASGRSDGYVAGGGPGFTGMADTVGRAAMAAEERLSVGRTLPPWRKASSEDSRDR